MADAVWVLGTSMTRFGRYPELDAVDLAARACLDALDDGGVSIHDMDVMGAGTLFQAQSGMGQRVQKQIGQTGIPVFNVTNACATGATALRTVDGLDLARLREAFGYDLATVKATVCESLQTSGYARLTPNRLVLTDTGLFLADGIAAELLPG